MKKEWNILSEEGEEPQIEESAAEPAASYTQREPLISQEVQDVINLRRFMEGEKEAKPEKSAIDRLMETMIVDYLMDRMEERRKGKKSPSLTPEDIAKAVTNAVTEAIKPLIPQKQEEEMPEWAKEQQKQLQDILQRLTKEEEEEKTKKIIEEAQRPLLEQIKERDHIIEKLQERLNELSEKYENLGTGSGGGGKDKLDVYLEIDEKLEQALSRKKPKPGTVWLSDEEGPIPVSGELPAWVVYGPIVADKIMTAVEKRLNNIASRWMELAQSPQPEQPQPKREELIRLPPKPQMPEETKEVPKEEARPAEVEVKTEVEVKQEKEAEKQAEELSKMPELIKIPEKPKVEETQVYYTREDLEKKKMPELWSIAKQLRIPKKGKKAELIDRILKASEEEKDERETSA